MSHNDFPNNTVWVNDCFDIDSIQFYNTEPSVFANTNKCAIHSGKKDMELPNKRMRSAKETQVISDKPMLNLILPRIPISTSESEIACLFQLWDIGKTTEIQFVYHSRFFKKAYVKIAYWFNCQESIEMKKELLQGRSIKKMYAIHPDSIRLLDGVPSNEMNTSYDNENIETEFYWIIQPNTQEKGGNRRTKIHIGDIKTNKTKTDAKIDSGVFVEQSFDYIHIDYIEQLIRVNTELKTDILELNKTVNSFEININELFYSFRHNLDEYRRVIVEDGLLHESNTLYGIEYENMFLYNKKQEILTEIQDWLFETDCN
jgi:hypothetical protein